MMIYCKNDGIENYTESHEVIEEFLVEKYGNYCLKFLKLAYTVRFSKTVVYF